jgi:small-conductance mechanosensitive channel
MNAGIYILGAALLVHTIPGLRRISYALFASAGFLGIVVGFAAQEAFSNIISGIFIAIFNPFRVGDKIEASAQYGTVEDITLRHTVIKTPDNERVIVPNTKIVNDNIKNYSIIDEKSRYRVDIPISYRDDIDRAKEIILEEADAHELTKKGESTVITKNLADSGVILELRLWSHDRADAWQAGTDLRETIKKRFDEEDITIPFPQRTIHYGDGARTDSSPEEI